MCYNIVEKFYRKVGIIYMRNFYNFMRHYWLINWWILVHSFKELMCLIRGESLEPSLTPQTISKYIQGLQDGEFPTELPMGAYEYDCCVEYLKKIRRLLKASRNDFKSLVLVFDEQDSRQIVIPPLEDCLQKVSKKVGFNVIDEKAFEERYEYTLESVFWR